jgi:membrane fusion protein
MEQSPLFREEMLQARRRRLPGELVALHSMRHWVLIGGFIAVLAALLIWAALAEFARIEVVPGLVATRTPVVRIAADRGGTVQQLNVREGQPVSRGDLLLVVNTEQGRSAPGSREAADVRLSAETERLAEEQLSVEAARAEAARQGLAATITGLSDQMRRLSAQIAVQAKLVESSQAMLESVKGIHDRGYISRQEFERRAAEALRNEQQLDELYGRVASTRMELARARAQMRAGPADEVQRRAALSSSLNSANRSRLAAESLASYAVRASGDATVTAVQTAVGDRVQAGSALLALVPRGSGLRLEAFAPSRAAGMVGPGQRVRIRYDAFPSDRFGTFGGTIESVSAVPLLPGDGRAAIKLSEPTYLILIRLDDTAVASGAQRLALRAGMRAEVSLILERRSVLASVLPAALTGRR